MTEYTLEDVDLTEADDEELDYLLEDDGTHVTLEEYLAAVEDDGDSTLYATNWDDPDMVDCD